MIGLPYSKLLWTDISWVYLYMSSVHHIYQMRPNCYRKITSHYSSTSHHVHCCFVASNLKLIELEFWPFGLEIPLHNYNICVAHQWWSWVLLLHEALPSKTRRAWFPSWWPQCEPCEVPQASYQHMQAVLLSHKHRFIWIGYQAKTNSISTQTTNQLPSTYKPLLRVVVNRTSYNKYVMLL